MTDQPSRFSEKEFLRYTRHLQLPNVGVEGQLKLKLSHVCIIGCGGLGAPVGLYLAAAGVGHITLIDDDVVDLSNLQRQVTFSESDIGKSKVQQTRERLFGLNSDIKITINEVRLSKENAQELLQGCDLVVDCSDNFDARYAINDCCKAIKVAWLYASIFQYSGQCALFKPEGPCYRCVFPSPDEQAIDCNTAGVIGVLPGIMGSVQALEAIKYLLDLDGVLDNELMLFETLPMGVRKIKLQQDCNCPACFPEKNAIKDPDDIGESCALTSNQPSAAKGESNMQEILDVSELDNILSKENVLLVDVRNPDEHQAFNLGGLNIPLHELSETVLPESDTVIFYCHAGARSLQAINLVRDEYEDITFFSLRGGVVEYLKQRSE